MFGSEILDIAVGMVLVYLLLSLILTAVQDYENGDPAALAALLTPDEAVRTYLDALRWSTDVLRSVSPRQDSAAASTTVS